MKNTHQHDSANSTKSGKLRQAAGALTVLLLLGASAAAQNSVGPFSGQYQEGFENSASLAVGFAPNSVLQGNANYHTAWGLRTTSWKFDCLIQPNAGAWFVGETGGLSYLEFNTPPARFGAYFGSNQPGGPTTVDVRFLDSANAVLFTDTRTIPNNCTWSWMGWDITTLGVSRIEFVKSGTFGFMMMDDLELDLPVVNTCFETFCFGDNVTTACPCGNSLPNNTISGCGNTTGVGATLSMSGSCSSSVADARLMAENLIPYRWALFFEGGSTLPSFGAPFYDGILCVGAPYAGVQFVVADVTGVAGPITDIFYKGLPYMPNHLPGYTSYYQCFYNDDAYGVCGTRWNLTNGVKLTWTP